MDVDEPPPSPKSAAGNNMLPPCITRLTRLQDLRLAGDWRRPKVRPSPPPPHYDAAAAQRGMCLRRGAIPQRDLSPPFLPVALADPSTAPDVIHHARHFVYESVRPARIWLCGGPHMGCFRLVHPRFTAVETPNIMQYTVVLIIVSQGVGERCLGRCGLNVARVRMLTAPA